MKKYRYLFFSLTCFLIFGSILVFSQVSAVSGTPVFYKGPFPVSSITCGETYNFDVTNYSGTTIWLKQFKGSDKTFDGPFFVPMGAYTSACNQDEGTYQASAYEVADCGGTNCQGNLIGSASLVINSVYTPTPSPTPTPTPSPTPSSTPTPTPAIMATPVYYRGPFTVSSVTCGEIYSFDVSGYSNRNVWLEQSKNGTIILNGPYAVPMAPYTSVCRQDDPKGIGDEGSYVTKVWQLASCAGLDCKGTSFGSATLTINPKVVTTPTPMPSPTPSGTATPIPTMTPTSMPTPSRTPTPTPTSVRTPTPSPTISPTVSPTITPTIGPTVTPVDFSRPYFTFSHDGGTLIATKDAWTFTLNNGQVGDRLQVYANLTSADNRSSVSRGQLQICIIKEGTSCSLTRLAPLGDVGTWYEDVYINSDYQKKIVFTVVPPAPITRVEQTRIYDLSEISDGDLIRGQDETAVWIVKIIGAKKYKRWLFGPQIFSAYGHLGFDRVKNISVGMLDLFETAVLIRRDGDEKIYELSDFVPGESATRRWIESEEVFLQRGYDFESVYVVNEREFNLYTEGASINSGSSGGNRQEPDAPARRLYQKKPDIFTANLSQAMARFFGW